MHSKIIQISDTPISKDDWISESDFYEGGFVGWIADYVDDEVTDSIRSNTIDDFLDKFNGMVEVWDITDEAEPNIVSFSVQDGFRKKYAQNSIDKFKKLVSQITVDDFPEGARIMADLCLGDQLGTYIFYDDGLVTLVQWLSSVQEGVDYYIGAVLDYHW